MNRSTRRRRPSARALLLCALILVVVAGAALPAFANQHELVPGRELLESLLGGDEGEEAGPASEPVFATAPQVALRLPSPTVEMIGFHQANHHGAQSLSARDAGTSTTTMPSRGRATGSRSAADVVAAPGEPVLAPVTGRVVRAGSYALYCRYPDHYVVIEPDTRPGWEVKLLHFEGLQVEAGDRVAASRTVLGSRPRELPVDSQVDDYSHRRDWPHLHLEVVDPSVPTPPSAGC